MNAFNELLGLHAQPKDLDVLQVCVRAVLVYVAALVIVRCAQRRFLSKMSAFDVILGFMLGSMLARAINGSAPFWPTLAGGLVLVLLHRIVAALSFYSEGFGRLVKGEPDTVVQNGVASTTALTRHKISQKDLLEEIRLQGKIDSVEQVQTATLERSGTISVVPRESK